MEFLSHYPERNLHAEEALGTRESRITLSRTPDGKKNGKAVIFIHGYGGSAIKTWKEFHTLLPKSPGFEGYDLIFYGYDGKHSTTTASASIFGAFLDRLFRHPFSIIGPCLSSTNVNRDWDQFRYQQVILAAHSLGAVICRWSLLFAHEKGFDWPNRTVMVLYAPAHRGAKVVDLIRENTGILGRVTTAIRYDSPLIDELAPGSEALHDLQEKTINAINAGDGSYLIARQVVIAERERIVQNLTFAKDPPPRAFPGTTHGSVCKPRKTFLDPIDVLSMAIYD